MKYSILCAGLLGLLGIFKVEASTFAKVYDGTAVICPAEDFEGLNKYQKQFKVRALRGGLLVRLEKCQNGNWAKDPSPQLEVNNWVEPRTGQSTEVRWSFSDYHLVISDLNGFVISEWAVPEVDQDGQTFISAQVLSSLPPRFHLHLWSKTGLEADRRVLAEPVREDFGLFLIEH